MDKETKEYEYKGNTYILIGVAQSKNSSNGQWEDHVLYQRKHTTLGPRITFTREIKDFYAKFKSLSKESCKT